jgi:phosphatidylserine/phosphatidylglycerophosphate/cardiolipin synthase-like enzyme
VPATAQQPSNADVPVWIDAKAANAHNKVMVIDDATVITGSFNSRCRQNEHSTRRT